MSIAFIIIILSSLSGKYQQNKAINESNVIEVGFYSLELSVCPRWIMSIRFMKYLALSTTITLF